MCLELSPHRTASSARACRPQASGSACPGMPSPAGHLRQVPAWPFALDLEPDQGRPEKQGEGGPGLPPEPKVGLPPAQPSSRHECQSSPGSFSSRAWERHPHSLLLPHPCLPEPPPPCRSHPIPASQDLSVSLAQTQPHSPSPSLAPGSRDEGT